MTDHRMICPACDGDKNPRHYLCRGCWYTLPRGARTALYRRDTRAADRLQELYRQLQDGVALHKIEVGR